MKHAFWAALCTLGIATAAITQAAPRPPTPRLPSEGGTGPAVLGAREFIGILGADPITVTARLKPDASYATLQVGSFKYVPLSDGLAVRFVVASGEVVTSRQVHLQRPVLKDLHVPMRNGGIRHVPLVALDICVGDTPIEVHFRLYQRHDYGPAMTLAAPQLEQLGARVDAQRSFTRPPNCVEPASATSTATPSTVPGVIQPSED